MAFDTFDEGILDWPPEVGREAQEVLGRDMLISEAKHEVIQKGLTELFDHSGIELANIDARDFGSARSHTFDPKLA
jgi:hypothetical protein